MRSLLVRLLVAVALGGVSAPVIAMPSAVATMSPHIVGTWPNTSGAATGGWILWSNGKVETVGLAPFYGDARRSGLNDFVGMIAANDAGGDGYFLLTTAGRVFSFGPTCGSGSLVPPAHRPTSGVVGAIYPVDTAGFDMVTSTGAVYKFKCEFSA